MKSNEKELVASNEKKEKLRALDKKLFDRNQFLEGENTELKKQCHKLGRDSLKLIDYVKLETRSTVVYRDYIQEHLQLLIADTEQRSSRSLLKRCFKRNQNAVPKVSGPLNFLKVLSFWRS